ncbi:ribonucleoside hydrolase [Intrasporangium chromatireducens Q5-1]|uniref:Ribonucleoside hydrolase n=1 Tax=Intrasporangium chromatireducens Q5-1 TaxID=584657 RepID=W9GFB5_9MICO|nr:nucleoside hydrolase [Intrasporangium chromatireducens]EWT04765.1 ribonucleoside hydrolase [Intrasporangium chromatireducens Q5-1]
MAGLPIVIDCDPGHDDAVALLLAVGSEAVDLKAVTTTFGNCSVEDATRNAVQILTLAGTTDVPVARGAAGSLDGLSTLGNYVHGASGLDGPPMPEPGFEVTGGDAVELLRRVIESSDEKVTIAATGPITNVAQLLLTRPAVKDGIREVIFMGGSTERGNHTPTAEFNTYADPEALDVVLGSGLPVRMVGLNLTHQALANPEVVERMAAMDHVVGRTCAAWMGFFGASYNRVWEFSAPPVHDPCTIAAIIQPDLIEWREAFVAVELDGRWTRGTTVVDLHRRYPEQEPNAQVAMTLDAERYWDLVIEAVDHVGRRR